MIYLSLLKISIGLEYAASDRGARGGGMQAERIENPDQLLFAVYCIENVAEELGIGGLDCYRLLAKRSGILNDYIVPCADVLHTQGKRYIVDDIISVMRKRGILE